MVKRTVTWRGWYPFKKQWIWRRQHTRRWAKSTQKTQVANKYTHETPYLAIYTCAEEMPHLLRKISLQLLKKHQHAVYMFSIKEGMKSRIFFDPHLQTGRLTNLNMFRRKVLGNPTHSKMKNTMKRVFTLQKMDTEYSSFQKGGQSRNARWKLWQLWAITVVPQNGCAMVPLSHPYSQHVRCGSTILWAAAYENCFQVTCKLQEDNPGCKSADRMFMVSEELTPGFTQKPGRLCCVRGKL